MAFDPVQENCLRLILSTMQREHVYPLDNAPYVGSRIEMFRRDPDSLVGNDVDRAFNLVFHATELLDYQLPFIMDDAEADEVLAQAEGMLEEALSLDEGNWDATRMLMTLRLTASEDCYRYLDEHVDEVFASYAAAVEHPENPYEREYAADLARRPYQRWLAALASKALIAGHYGRALDVCMRSLAFAPDDPADVRYTAVLALAKLERDADELEQLRDALPLAFGRQRHMDAWTLLARIAIAYKQLDLASANRAVDELFSCYPGVAQQLYQQIEFPDGIFSRVCTAPGSENELALAISEATPLLQEGAGAPDNAPLALWLAEHPRTLAELDRAERARAVRSRHRHRPEDEG